MEMFTRFFPSISRITNVRSELPPCLVISAERNSPAPSSFTSSLVVLLAGLLVNPWMRTGLSTAPINMDAIIIILFFMNNYL